MTGSLDAQGMARTLLRLLKEDVPVAVQADPPAYAWRRAGLMEVTGRADGPPLMCPVPLTTLADAALAAFRVVTGATGLPENGALLLGERARMLGLTRQGAISPNGSCRILPCRTGALALNLPREDDWDLATAMVQQVVRDWDGLAVALSRAQADEMVARGRMLGLALAEVHAPPLAAPPPAPFVIDRGNVRRPRKERPLVVDLSALWAGPLAASLLAMAGARVIKVESAQRLDGARAGHPGFFNLLNGAKESLTLDFANPAGRAELHRLVEEADIIIEASRPRALRQLGIDAARQVARGAVWMSITAHGRTGAAANWIGFGDDAAVAGGLASAMQAAWGDPLFAGDAVADPLTGLVAALAGWSLWRQGAGGLVSLAMANVVAFAGAGGVAGPAACRAWQAMAEADTAPLYPSREAF